MNKLWIVFFLPGMVLLASMGVPCAVGVRGASQVL